MARCRYCGNIETFEHDQRDKTCPRNSCKTCRHLDSLDEEISIVKARLEYLMKYRHDLQSKYDVLHKSIIDRLPIELASHIFELCVEDYYPWTNHSFQKSRLRLGAVSRNWRRIAWSTPRLWTTLVVTFGLSTQQNDIRARLAMEWLGRSGQLPLYIVVALPKDRRQQLQEEITYPLIDALGQCSNRWDKLDLLYLTPSMLSRFHDAHVTPALRDLRIFLGREVGPIGITRAKPSSISILNVPLRYLGLQWNNLTHMVARGLFINEVLEIQSLALQLEDLRFIFLGVDRSIPVKTPRLVAHNRLNVFEIENFCSVDDLGLLLSNLNFPALTNLKLRSSKGTRLPIDPIVSFFERSSCRLKTLRLQSAMVTGDELIQMANKLSSLENLQLIASAEDSPLAWNTFLFALSGAVTSVDHQTMPLLPGLKKFDCMGSCFFPWHTIPGLFSPFERADIRRRRPLENLLIFSKCIVDREAPVIERHLLYQLLDLHDANINICIMAGYLNGQKDIFSLSFNKIRRDLEGDRDWSTALSDPSDIAHFWDLPN